MAWSYFLNDNLKSLGNRLSWNRQMVGTSVKARVVKDWNKAVALGILLEKNKS